MEDGKHLKIAKEKERKPWVEHVIDRAKYYILKGMIYEWRKNSY